MAGGDELMSEAEAFAVHQLRGDRFGWYWHHHAGWETFAVRRGSGQALVGDHAGDFRAGDVFVLAPRLAHCFWSRSARGGPVDTLYLHVDDALVRPLARLPGSERVATLLARADHGWRFRGPVAAAIAADTSRWRPREPIWYAAWCAALLRLAAGREGVELSATPAVGAGDRGVAERILALIAERYAEPLTIAALARAAAVGRSAACAAVRSATGRTILALVREARLAEACRLLAATSLPVDAIARRVGWSDGSSFARAFAAAFGTSPGRWRR
jgi:AraC-like DNA-binding protein